MEKDILGLSLLRFDLWIFPGTVNISTYGLYGIEFENPRIGGLFERTAFIRVVEEDSKNSYFEFTREFSFEFLKLVYHSFPVYP